jgi:hypothetical protein
MTMGHVNTIIELLKRRVAQSQTAAPTSAKTYDLPGLQGYSAPPPDQILMYKQEYNHALKAKKDAELALTKKPLKKKDREQHRSLLRDAEQNLEHFAMKIGRLLPMEREYGFPEADGYAK